MLPREVESAAALVFSSCAVALGLLVSTLFTYECRVVREMVSGLQGEQRRRGNSALRDSLTDQHHRDLVQLDKLWPVCEVFSQPGECNVDESESVFIFFALKFQPSLIS